VQKEAESVIKRDNSRSCVCAEQSNKDKATLKRTPFRSSQSEWEEAMSGFYCARPDSEYKINEADCHSVLAGIIPSAFNAQEIAARASLSCIALD